MAICSLHVFRHLYCATSPLRVSTMTISNVRFVCARPGGLVVSRCHREDRPSSFGSSLSREAWTRLPNCCSACPMPAKKVQLKAMKRKRGTKKDRKAAKKKYTHLSPTEIAQCKTWHAEGMGIKKIGKLLGRGKSSVSRHVIKTNMKKRAKGRPIAITEEVFSRLDAKMTEMQKKAEGTYDVTAAMVKKAARCKASTKRIREAFKAHGKPFRKLREKPILTEDDVKVRHVFGKKHGSKTGTGWGSKPRGIIDNKSFQMYLNSAARNYAARRTVRGAYRDGQSAVRPDLVKPKEALRYPAPRLMVTAAVIKGRIRLWHVTPGVWNAKRAAEMSCA
jgi:transposase